MGGIGTKWGQVNPGVKDILCDTKQIDSVNLRNNRDGIWCAATLAHDEMVEQHVLCRFPKIVESRAPRAPRHSIFAGWEPIGIRVGC